MKLKTVKRMNACILSAAMVLSGVTIIPPATVSAAANNEINYALSATATVSDQETNYWGADKAIDGNRQQRCCKGRSVEMGNESEYKSGGKDADGESRYTEDI